MATGREIHKIFWSHRHYVWNIPDMLQKNTNMENEIGYLKDQDVHHVDHPGQGELRKYVLKWQHENVHVGST